jgi:hypothetical protein
MVYLPDDCSWIQGDTQGAEVVSAEEEGVNRFGVFVLPVLREAPEDEALVVEIRGRPVTIGVLRFHGYLGESKALDRALEHPGPVCKSRCPRRKA